MVGIRGHRGAFVVVFAPAFAQEASYKGWEWFMDSFFVSSVPELPDGVCGRERRRGPRAEGVRCITQKTWFCLDFVSCLPFFLQFSSARVSAPARGQNFEAGTGLQDLQGF